MPQPRAKLAASCELGPPARTLGAADPEATSHAGCPESVGDPERQARLTGSCIRSPFALRAHAPPVEAVAAGPVDARVACARAAFPSS